MEPLFKDKMEEDKYKFTKKNTEQKVVPSLKKYTSKSLKKPLKTAKVNLELRCCQLFQGALGIPKNTQIEANFSFSFFQFLHREALFVK
jgi:hypothetical protein